MAINIPILSSLDTKGFDKAQREFALLTKTSDKASFLLKKAFIPAAAALGGLGVAAFGAAKMASDLNEETSKTKVIFKDASGAIEDFSKSAADGLGQSQTEALKAAGTFGVLGQAAGLTGTDLKDMAVKFTTLATDLASFNNTSPEDAVLALGAGLRGEAEPLRRYGILLDDATLRAKALELGLVKTTKDALDPQTKSLAAQAVILEKTTLQQGDFARTADSAANQQRILTARIKDAKTNIGKGFLPVMAIAVELLSQFAGFAKDNAPLIGAIAIVLGGVAGALILANVAMAAWNAIGIITTGVNIALATSFTAVQVSTVLGIATAIAGAGTMVLLAKKIKGTVSANTDAKNASDLAAKSTKDYEAMLKKLEGQTEKTTGVTKEKTAAQLKAEAADKKAKAAAKELAAELAKLKDVLRDQMVTALENANKVLDDAIGKFDAYKKSVSDSIASGFSFGAAQKLAEDNTRAIADASIDLAKAQANVAKAMKSTDPQDLTDAYADLAVAQDKLNAAKSAPTTFLANLKSEATKVKKFGELVNRLIAADLSETALAQVLAAGTDAGTAIAEELLSSAGGVMEANALTKDVQDMADRVAANAAKKFYQAGIDSGTNLVAGIQAVVDNYTIKLNAAVTIADVKGLTAGFDAATTGGGVSNPLAGLSPSDIGNMDFSGIDFSGIDFGGLNFGMGTLMADGGIVTRATTITAGEAGAEAIIPLSRAGEFGLGGGGNITINVHGGDPQAVVDALRRYNRSNGPIPVKVQ